MLGKDVVLGDNVQTGCRQGRWHLPAGIQIRAYPEPVLCCFLVSPLYILAMIFLVKIRVMVSKLCIA